jgi:hypothetical protein
VAADKDDAFAGSVFFGGGISGRLSDNAVTLNATGSKAETGGNAFVFSLIGGGGYRFQNNVYLGGEVLLDFGKSRKSYINIDNSRVKVASNVFSTSVGLRCGYCDLSPGLMAFGKLGVTNSKIEAECGSNRLSSPCVTPLIGVGLEKYVSRKYTVRLDLEYSPYRKSTNDFMKVKRGRSLKLQAMIVHNVRTD